MVKSCYIQKDKVVWMQSSSDFKTKILRVILKVLGFNVSKIMPGVSGLKFKILNKTLK